MAINLVCAVLDRGPQNPTEKLVLLAIADSADKDSGEAWPSQKTIARRACITDRAVRAVVKRLQDAGWLRTEARKRANGSCASTLYTLDLRKLGEARGAEPRSAPPGTTFRPPPEPRSTHAPEPRSALEPSQNIEPCAQSPDAAPPAPSALPQSAAAGAGSKGEGSAVAQEAQALAPKLSGFQRNLITTGQRCVVDCKLISPADPLHAALAAKLREDATKSIDPCQWRAQLEQSTRHIRALAEKKAVQHA